MFKIKTNRKTNTKIKQKRKRKKSHKYKIKKFLKIHKNWRGNKTKTCIELRQNSCFNQKFLKKQQNKHKKNSKFSIRNGSKISNLNF